ncbi:MAG TPA: histidine kinase [Cyclobacteriaceae bacterium]|nr:histidine kinase [Cyclobacteriaceae bacterium]
MRRYLVAYLIIFAASLVAFMVRLASGQFSLKLNVILIFVFMALLSFTWEVLRYINRTLNRTMPFEKGISKRIAVQLVAGGVFCLFVRYLLYLFGEPYVPLKLDSMFVATTWVLYVFASAAINSIFFTEFFLERWKDSLVQAERLEKEKSYVQFDNLKNQLNPHFLFNALTSLNSLIAENPSLASQFLQHMSRVYRYVLQNKEKSFVGLKTELDFIGNYVFLAETRFGKALRITFNIPAEALEKAVVPVTLQILIENALKHNIAEIERPLVININVQDNYLIVRNNLQLRKIVETSNKQGLENLRSLYRFLTERPVLVGQDENSFRVKVPLL